MKIFKTIIKITILILLLIIIILISTFNPKTIILNEITNKAEKEDIITNISDKHKIIFISDSENEKSEIIKTFIVSTDLSKYVDYVYIDVSDQENSIFINSILGTKTLEKDMFVLMDRTTNIVNTFETNTETSEIILSLKQYFEKFL